jgi:hypothetical protein
MLKLLGDFKLWSRPVLASSAELRPLSSQGEAIGQKSHQTSHANSQSSEMSITERAWLLPVFEGEGARVNSYRNIRKRPAQRAAHGAFANYAPIAPPIVDHRRVLHDIASLRHEDLKSGVVEITNRPLVQARLDRLVDASVQTDEVTARAQREPIEVDSESLKQRSSEPRRRTRAHVEVEGDVLKCLRLDIQPRRLEFEPGASRSRTVSSACPRLSRQLRQGPIELKCRSLPVLT